MMPNKNKIILDLCGGTGSWSNPYKKAGYDVRIITLPEFDVCTYIPPNNVYGIFAAPPCTEFSFAKHFHGKGKYFHDFSQGLKIVLACLHIIANTYPKFWCLENPRGYLRKFMGTPDFIFDPWEFGDFYQKKTELWGKFTFPVRSVTTRPPGIKKFSLLLSHEIHPEYYGIFNRTVRRAITPKGFANAFFKENQ